MKIYLKFTVTIKDQKLRLEVKFPLYIHLKTSPSIFSLFFSFLLFAITQYIWPSSRWLHYFTLVFICKYIILNTLINILIMTKIKARYAQKYFPNCLGYNISSVVPYIFSLICDLFIFL